MTFEELLRNLAARIVRIDRPHPIKVAIDGIDAAGKTTLADAVAAVMEAGGREVVRASIDGFHRPRSERAARGALSALGYYEDSFDYGRLEEALLAPLSDRHPGGFHRKVFDYRNDRPAAVEAEMCRSDAILLFDGVFLFRPEINARWDYRIFLDVSFDEALRRAVARDSATMGGDAATEERYRKRYLPGQELYFRRVGPRSLADVVILFDDPSAPEIASTETA